MKKRIYILNGHPAESSLSKIFAETYAKTARAAGHEVRLSHLRDFQFDSDFGHSSFNKAKPLEPSLEKLLLDIEWSEHMVLTSPLWWGGLPAKLKGAIDRAFLPGRTFDTRVKDGTFPKPLLSGRSARVIITSDTPNWYLHIFYRNAIFQQLKKQILGFVGLKPSRFTHFSGASNAKPKDIARWVSKIEKIAATAK
ncbi:NAD(P)H-dependent oxidoreductase [Ahrensia sp. 13_GOM-1096m]|uniref:NAD(P)H-dependent oxidoreductase n=1 Tax=Ahrensia sp. 13_GOM-1096m TaxID=1380380 RepID=UPI00054FE494|nr:NAD(P)H-dependent oxidoreductase [Ahrensia sp. 13_GOM-1096m]